MVHIVIKTVPMGTVPTIVIKLHKDSNSYETIIDGLFSRSNQIYNFDSKSNFIIASVRNVTVKIQYITVRLSRI